MNKTISCPICGQNCTHAQRVGNRDVTIYACPVCGEYGVTRPAALDLGRIHPEARAKISAYIRERHIRQDPLITLLSETPRSGSTDIPVVGINDVLKAGFPAKISDRLDRALGNLHRYSSYPGAEIPLNAKHDYPLLFAENEDSFEFILRTLESAGLIAVKGAPEAYVVFLTYAGWNKIAEIERAVPTANSKQAFVAMWFSADLDAAYKAGFEQAIKAAGYKALRMDLKEHNEKICDAIIAEIRKSRFIVADFTGYRGGVYSEAGYALGLGIPVIWTCREDHRSELHFDTRQFNHIFWTDENDLFEKLRRRIEATISS